MWWIYVVLIQSLCFADILTATTALNQVGWSDFFNQQSQNHNMCENSRWTCWWSGATRPFLQQLLIFFLKSSNSLCNPADNTVRTQRLKSLMPREPSKANHEPNLLFQGFAWWCIGLPFICLFWTLARTSFVTSERCISYDRPPWGVLQTYSVITQLKLCPGREKAHYLPYYSAVKVKFLLLSPATWHHSP